MATDAATLRVLVVDDSTDTTESASMLLRLWGHHAREAYSGAGAIAITLDYRPDVIFLDIGLPDMDGWEVARRLRGQSPPCNAFLVAMSGFGTDDDRRRSLDAGFDAHLLKPVDPQEVQSLLDHIGRTG